MPSKLLNKKTGEVGEFICLQADYVAPMVLTYRYDDGKIEMKDYESLAEFNKEWEDYEDELLYVVSAEHRSGYQCVLKEDYPEICKVAKELGIGFETEKECQKAVECLRAWKRLKDKGFRFNGVTPMGYFIRFTYDKPRQILDNQQRPEVAQQFNKDLDLLFGGEE